MGGGKGGCLQETSRDVSKLTGLQVVLVIMSCLDSSVAADTLKTHTVTSLSPSRGRGERTLAMQARLPVGPQQP